MTTPLDIIRLALKDIGVLGVGQSALSEDTNDAFVRLNQMISQWNRKRWLVWHLVTVGFASTGAQSYTVGAGGDFNIPRPDKIEAAFFRQTVQSLPNQIDYPLEQLFSREDYNNIALKGLTSFPSYFFYDSAYPLGSVYPWPIPQATIYSLYVTVKHTLDQFTSITQSVDFPPEYLPALEWNLAQRLCVGYSKPVPPDIKAMAVDSLNVIRESNFQIARLQMPRSLIRPGVYNPYSDQIR